MGSAPGRAAAARMRQLVLALAAALAGCSSLIPPYQRPAPPVPPTYPADTLPAAAAGSEAPADIDWQRFFADPRLKQLIALALANNRDLRVAVLNIEQTRALYQVRRADELPTVGAGATVSRQPVGTGVATVVRGRLRGGELRARPVRPRP